MHNVCPSLGKYQYAGKLQGSSKPYRLDTGVSCRSHHTHNSCLLCIEVHMKRKREKGKRKRETGTEREKIWRSEEKSEKSYSPRESVVLTNQSHAYLQEWVSVCGRSHTLPVVKREYRTSQRVCTLNFRTKLGSYQQKKCARYNSLSWSVGSFAMWFSKHSPASVLWNARIHTFGFCRVKPRLHRRGRVLLDRHVNSLGHRQCAIGQGDKIVTHCCISYPSTWPRNTPSNNIRKGL